MKRKLLTTLCALSVTTCTAFLSNNAHAATKAELKHYLSELDADITLAGKVVKPSETMLQRVYKFIDDCEGLTEDQYDAIIVAAGWLAASVSQSEAKTLEELNKDEDFREKVNQAIDVLKEKIPGLEVTLTGACKGTIKLGNATLNVDDNFLKEVIVTVTNAELSNAGTSAASKKAGTSASDKKTGASTSDKKASTSTSAKKCSKCNTIKATGADIDLTAASLTAIVSLFTVLGAMAIARKKRIFE